jgi:outer membrane protein OmpA-like peptidoglycan-associated protein/uncharacterized protein YegL
MKKIFLIICFLIVQNYSFSQGAVSGNGQFIASIFSKNNQKIIYVHKFMTRQLIRKINLNTNSQIDKIKFSYSGKFLYIQNGTTFKIFNVIQQKLITTIFGAIDIYFPHGNQDFFISLNPNSIVKYNTLTKVTFSYTYPTAKRIFKLILSPNDDIFIAQATNRLYIYNIKLRNIQKNLNAFSARFKNNGKYFTTMSNLAGNIKFSTYSSSSFFLQRGFSSEILIKKYNLWNKVILDRCSLSNNGKYAAIYTAKNRMVKIYIFDTWSGNLLWQINNFANTNNELFPQKWTPNSHLIAFGQNLMAGDYNISSHTVIPIALRIDKVPIPQNIQQKIRNISPDYHYLALNYSGKLYIRDTRIPNKNITFQNAKFIGFSPDSKYIFIKKDNTINAIVCNQLTKAIQNNIPLNIYAFDKNISIVTKEKFIASDAKPPKGYAYFYVNNTKQIVKLDTAKLHYAFRSLKLDKNNVELQINLVDSHGNEFIGATDPSWKYIWCNLLIQNPKGIVYRVNNFSVKEIHKFAPTAYALVLDQSGSMGNKRANELQFGAWDMIQHKRPQDAFLLIKYDNHVKLMNGLTKQKYPLQRYLNNTGLKGFGGGTALIDAAYLAVKKLENAKNFNKKVIILFTDGYENASMYSKYDLLSEAAKANIEIDVVGFGNQINENYLKSIAYNTGGLYIHLYKTKDLRKVFRDVDFKRKNYYSIKFKTKTLGKHIALLQLCQEITKHDSIWIPFDNSTENKRIDIRNPIPSLKRKNIHLTKFNQLKIPINPILKPVKSKKINSDFSNIHFPNIQFATASDVIIKSEKKGIDEIVKFMRKYPNVYLEIHGHTDNMGTPKFNKELSIRRAKAAKKLIVKAGIAPGRIITRGFGATKPLASNDTEQGRAKNRRIEFYISVQK